MKYLIEKLDKKGKVESSEEIEAYDWNEAVRIILDRSNLRLRVIEESTPNLNLPPQATVKSMPGKQKGGEVNVKKTND